MNDWLPVLQVLPGVSVTLLAIAFVTFQVKLDIWSELPLRQSVALSSLAELSAPMFFSIIALMPGNPWMLAGYVTGLVGYLIIAVHVTLYWRTRKEKRTRFDRIQLYGAGILLLTFSLLFWAPDIQTKIWVLIWMLFSGTVESWWFLNVAPGKASQPGS